MLVVVNQIDIVDIALVKGEDDPPVAGNRNASKRLQVAFEGMKPVSGQDEVRRLVGVIKVRQSNREPIGLIGAHPTTITSLVEAL